MGRAGRSSGFLPVAGGLTATAWLTLWLWGQSPYARYLEHGNWTELGSAAVICHALPGGDLLLPLTLYAGGWVLMIAAMMLPTTLPLLDRFARLVGDRVDRRRLIGLVIIGYLLVWAGFGVAAHLLDAALHERAQQMAWLAFNGWALGAAVLAIAGLFQFSRLKYRCLAKCRTPLSFVAKHWHGPNPLRNALLLGLDHGVFCVGCCWAIMLLDVCRRHRKCRLDAGARPADGGGEEHAMGGTAQSAVGCRTAGCRGGCRRGQPRRLTECCCRPNGPGLRSFSFRACSGTDTAHVATPAQAGAYKSGLVVRGLRLPRRGYS